MAKAEKATKRVANKNYRKDKNRRRIAEANSDSGVLTWAQTGAR
jgi:hypothetical protein